MASEGVQELTDRAGRLRGLADEIEALPDAAHTYATRTMKDWAGPNADDTRGELNTWRTRCRTVAAALRTEAGVCEKNANKLT
ncbi:hypothetical protein [Actinacidiphila reveromycinica]|nr:hypothetical protein [Streptomyces sp. SN-593]